MQLSLDETFLANDHHTYMKRQTQAAKLELPPHILDLRKWDGVTTGICVIVQARPRLFVPPRRLLASKDLTWIGSPRVHPMLSFERHMSCHSCKTRGRNGKRTRFFSGLFPKLPGCTSGWDAMDEAKDPLVSTGSCIRNRCWERIFVTLGQPH